VDVENGEIKGSKVVANTAAHGGGTCTAVTEILKYGITHVIAGGMGMGAQNKFAAANVPIFGCSGLAGNAVKALIESSLGGLDPCAGHDPDNGGCGH
jgi:predicted Fe-Mo cluster-binding NifX family protein